MGMNSQITAAAILTLAIAGCTIGDTPEASNTPSPASTPQANKQTPKPKSPFPNPVVSPTPKNPGLIAPTSPNLRANLPKGRPDPFAEIVKPISIPGTNNSSAPKQVPKLPPLPTQAPQRGIGSRILNRDRIVRIRTPISTTIPRPSVPRPSVPRPSANSEQITKTAPKPQAKPTTNPVVPKVLPPVAAKDPIKPVLPEIPEPETAQAVLVSGVVLIGKQPQAIIKVPDETTSRYVQAGQRLGNGVLIKRIEMNRGSNPIVILEQYGIEVAKAVGEKPVTKDSKTAAAGNYIAGVAL